MTERGEAPRLKLPRRIFLAWALISLGNVGAFAWVYAVQDRLSQTQNGVQATQKSLVRVTSTVRSNQCDILNRLAETKLFIRSFLEEALRVDGDTMPARKRKRYEEGIKDLSIGIDSLKTDIRRLPWCPLFPELEDA